MPCSSKRPTLSLCLLCVERERERENPIQKDDDFDDDDDSFYAVLGVERPTKKGGGTTGRNFPSEKTLERAYKRAALKYHPDRPNGDAEKFLRCTKAFETLKNPDLRKIYDTYGEKGLEPGFQPPERRPGERATPRRTRRGCGLVWRISRPEEVGRRAEATETGEIRSEELWRRRRRRRFWRHGTKQNEFRDR